MGPSRLLPALLLLLDDPAAAAAAAEGGVLHAHCAAVTQLSSHLQSARTTGEAASNTSTPRQQYTRQHTVPDIGCLGKAGCRLLQDHQLFKAVLLVHPAAEVPKLLWHERAAGELQAH
jgi:hypothetical protein